MINQSPIGKKLRLIQGIGAGWHLMHIPRKIVTTNKLEELAWTYPFGLFIRVAVGRFAAL